MSVRPPTEQKGRCTCALMDPFNWAWSVSHTATLPQEEIGMQNRANEHTNREMRAYACPNEDPKGFIPDSRGCSTGSRTGHNWASPVFPPRDQCRGSLLPIISGTTSCSSSLTSSSRPRVTSKPQVTPLHSSVDRHRTGDDSCSESLFLPATFLGVPSMCLACRWRVHACKT